MQFMVSVKTKKLLMLYIVFLIFYLSYLIFDYQFQNNQWRKDFANAKQKELLIYSPNALLLGGSNIVYSLSAELLSEKTGLRWFNFGLSSEAFNDKNYWKYVEKSLSNEQRSDIEIVVYSSLVFLRSGMLNERNSNDLDAWGNKPISLVPNMSIAGRTRTHIYQMKNTEGLLSGNYPLPLAYGDFDFDEISCLYDYPDGFEREKDSLLLKDWLFTQLGFMRDLFPNAELIITIPSEYYGEYYDLRSDEEMLKNLYDFQDDFQKYEPEVIFQPQFIHKSLTCDERHHANELGRLWRTNNLINQIKNIN